MEGLWRDCLNARSFHLLEKHREQRGAEELLLELD